MAQILIREISLVGCKGGFVRDSSKFSKEYRESLSGKFVSFEIYFLEKYLGRKIRLEYC